MEKRFVYKIILVVFVILELFVISILISSLVDQHKVKNIYPKITEKVNFIGNHYYFVKSNSTILVYEYQKNYNSSYLNTNSYGFRDDEFEVNENKKKVVVLGDSIAVGLGLEVAFPDLLEKCLNKNNDSIEVMNLAVEGYNTLQELELLKIFGLTFNPDFIVVQYSLNDLETYHLEVFLSQEEAKQRFNDIFLLVKNNATCSKYLDFEYDYYTDFVIKKYYNPCFLNILDYSFKSFSDISYNNSIPLILVIFPYNLSFYEERNLILLHEIIIDLAYKHSLRYIDLYPYFLNSSLELFEDHVHPNEEGHKIATEVICDYVDSLI